VQPSKHGPTAYDAKPVHERFTHFCADEVKQLRLLTVGRRLEQGATYIDLLITDRTLKAKVRTVLWMDCRTGNAQKARSYSAREGHL
jgi:hypothetical protein